MKLLYCVLSVYLDNFSFPCFEFECFICLSVAVKNLKIKKLVPVTCILVSRNYIRLIEVKIYFSKTVISP